MRQSTGRLHLRRVGSPSESALSPHDRTLAYHSSTTKASVLSVRDKLERAAIHGERTWSLINKHRGAPIIDLLYHVAMTLESHTTNLLSLEYIQHQQRTIEKLTSDSIPATSPRNNIALLQNFYCQPVLHVHKKHFSTSLYSQVISEPRTAPSLSEHYSSCSYYSLLDQLYQDDMEEQTINSTTLPMEEDSTSHSAPNATTLIRQQKKPKLTKQWEIDPSISQLSATFLENLQVEQAKLLEAGEDLDDAPKYKAPTDETEIVRQNRIRLSLRKARNSDSQPTLKLFKSFAQALRASDPSVAILPVSASKQNLPSLTTSAKVLAMDNNKVFTYFKSYYPNQKTTLSGYMYILTHLSIEDLLIAPPIYEWLEINRYTIKECPSHEEEMALIGALCFGSEFIYREDLKVAIQAHPEWKFPTLQNTPVIQLTRGEFRSSKKSKKMIFVHAEKSKQNDVACVLTKIYDGTSKAYPNGNMMLFIPLHDNIQYDAPYRQKVIYNHEQFLGDEAAIAIHGLQDLDYGVTLKNQQKITIRLLLRSLPATQGMTRPQLFQLAETNASRNYIIVTYQKGDKELVHSRLFSLENDIRAQLAEGEAGNIFISETDGLWFTPIARTKGGQIIQVKPTSKSNLAHIQHTNSILSSPPKKRQYHSQSSISSFGTGPITYVAVAQQQMPQETITTTYPPPARQLQEQPSDSSNLVRLTTAIDQRFQMVQEELDRNKIWQTSQQKWNDTMSGKMRSLEGTTTATDNKVDMILNKLDSWDIPTKRRGVTTTQEERNAPNPHLSGSYGDMES